MSELNVLSQIIIFPSTESEGRLDQGMVPSVMVTAGEAAISNLHEELITLMA